MLRDTAKEAIIAEEVFHATLQPWQRFLLAAAEVIKQRGHCQGTYEDSRGRVCALGAFNVVDTGCSYPMLFTLTNVMKKKLFGEDGDQHEGEEALLKYLREGSDRKINEWNDSPFRTEVEVIHTLQLVALG